MASITVERVLEAARAEVDAADAKRRRMSARKPFRGPAACLH
jgi:hypothetical protein